MLSYRCRTFRNFRSGNSVFVNVPGCGASSGRTVLWRTGGCSIRCRLVVVLVPVDDDVFRDGSRDANGRRVQLYYDNLMKKGTESEFCGKTTPATNMVAGVVLFEGNAGDIILRGPIV